MKSFNKFFESMLTRPAMPSWGRDGELSVPTGRPVVQQPTPAPRGWTW